MEATIEYKAIMKRAQNLGDFMGAIISRLDKRSRPLTKDQVNSLVNGAAEVRMLTTILTKIEKDQNG